MSRILVVDDDVDFLETINLTLASEGFEVETTYSQEDIYKNILSFNPEVILLDIHLNGADGRNICMGLKNHFRTKKIPVILCSGDVSQREQYPKYLAEDFIEKPLVVENLVNRLKHYCSAS